MTDQEHSERDVSPALADSAPRQKISGAVRTETLFILCFSGVLSLLMQSVFLLIGAWDLTVVWGNLLGLFASVGNFFFMAMTVQWSVERSPEGGKALMRTSLTVRMFCLFLILMIGALLSCFHTIAVLIPMIFPRIAIALSPWIRKKEKGTEPQTGGEITEDAAAEDSGADDTGEPPPES